MIIAERLVNRMNKAKKDSATKQMKLLVAMFEGRQITDAEARKIVVATNRQKRVLVETFGLSKEELGTVLANSRELSELIHTFCSKKQEEVLNRVRQMEAVALKKLRDPDGRRARNLRALLGPR